MEGDEAEAELDYMYEFTGNVYSKGKQDKQNITYRFSFEPSKIEHNLKYESTEVAPGIRVFCLCNGEWDFGLMYVRIERESTYSIMFTFLYLVCVKVRIGLLLYALLLLDCNGLF